MFTMVPGAQYCIYETVKSILRTKRKSAKIVDVWRDGRVVEGARLESVYSSNAIAGSNPVLSATFFE